MSVRLVSAIGLAAIKVGVDTRVGLVQHVRLVRTGRVGGRAAGVGVLQTDVVAGGGTADGVAGAAGGGGRAQGVAGSTTVVTVRVDTGVGSVGHAAAVRSVGALRGAGVEAGAGGGGVVSRTSRAQGVGVLSGAGGAHGGG